MCSRALGLSLAGGCSAAPAGSCLPRLPRAPACELMKQLRTPQRLCCTPGASPGTSISWGTAPLLPPSLSCSSTSAFLADMARGVCASHCNKPQRTGLSSDDSAGSLGSQGTASASWASAWKTDAACEHRSSCSPRH